MPRPSSDAAFRGDGRGASRATYAEWEEAPVRRLSRDEAEALRQRQPALSPWWVVLGQVVVGLVAAALVAAFAGDAVLIGSALYGAAVIAVPSALMARGATSRLSAISPVV